MLSEGAAPYARRVTPAELETRLRAFLVRETGEPAVEILGLRRVPGGASRETWAFDARFGTAAPQPLILRRDPGRTSVGSDRGLEFAVLRAVHASGVPVPKVLWLGNDSSILGTRFFIMERVEGEALARRLLRDPGYAEARAVMTGQLGAILAGIHAVSIAGPELAALPGQRDDGPAAVTELARYEELYRGLAPEPHPVIEYGLRWLRARMPATSRRALVHGDFRIGNVLFGPDGTRAVLDWEQAHVGDPMEDLGWMCVRAWRFGGALPVGGIGEREELFAAYERAGGGRVDSEVVRFWEAFGDLKWAVICIAQAKTYLDGGVKSVELASIGRRTAEAEHDLLELVD